MNKIIINGYIYNIHPVYNLYASNKAGEIFHIGKNEIMVGNKTM